MNPEPYTRFALTRPAHLGEANWQAIATEITRFESALEMNDDAHALGQLKCLVEATAKVALDINGTPAGGTEGFKAVVARAHDLLANQPGHELAYKSPYGQIATQAKKIAIAMAEIRNDFGSGHGRARNPELHDEMLDLAMDGSLQWTRWALRRLGYFAQGRPETLIRDLVGDPYGRSNFYRGDLTERLHVANLPDIEDRNARAIGVAVGQRSADDTVNVRVEGVEACVKDPDLERWPMPYRLGVATGLLTSPDEIPTLTARNLRLALAVCLPVETASEEITALIDGAMRIRPPGALPGDEQENTGLTWLVRQNSPDRPMAERPVWERLAEHLAS